MEKKVYILPTIDVMTFSYHHCMLAESGGLTYNPGEETNENLSKRHTTGTFLLEIESDVDDGWGNIWDEGN